LRAGSDPGETSVAKQGYGDSRVHALRDKYARNEEFIMPAPRFPLFQSRAPRRREKGALGLFQLLGLGLLLLFVVFLLIVVARSLFASA
jgi:hypothetical protein